MNILSNVIGQERARNMLHLLGSSFSRKNKLPPIGVFGNSGLGKTHIVYEFANWLNAKVLYINGTAIKDALSFRASFKEAINDKSNYYITFIDECHRLPDRVQDNLLSVLEDPAILCTVATKEMGNVNCIDGIRWIDKGDVIREALPGNMSFVFATTDPICLKQTVLSRLRKITLEPYSKMEKAEIAIRYLMSNNIEITNELALQLAERSRNIRHLKDDICETFIDLNHIKSDENNNKILDIVDDLLGIDSDGACDADIEYMQYLSTNKIAGLDTLAGVLKTDKKMLLTRIEPFLLEKQWITITGKGRKLTKLGYQKLFGKNTETFIE